MNSPDLRSSSFMHTSLSARASQDSGLSITSPETEEEEGSSLPGNEKANQEELAAACHLSMDSVITDCSQNVTRKSRMCGESRAVLRMRGKTFAALGSSSSSIPRLSRSCSLGGRANVRARLFSASESPGTSVGSVDSGDGSPVPSRGLSFSADTRMLSGEMNAFSSGVSSLFTAPLAHDQNDQCKSATAQRSTSVPEPMEVCAALLLDLSIHVL